MEQSQPQGSSAPPGGDQAGVSEGRVGTPSLEQDHLAGAGFPQLNLYSIPSASAKKKRLIRLLW